MTFSRARGTRPWWRRVLHPRTGPVLALCAAAAALAAPAPASAAAAAPGPFGLIPTPANGQPRPYFRLTIQPGGSATDTAIVSNQSSQTEHLHVTTSRGVTAQNSGSAFIATARRCEEAACWITGLPPEVTLAPHTQKIVHFRVTVPRFTGPRQYLAGLTAEQQGRMESVRVGHGHGSAKAIVIDQVTVGVAITVGDLARLRTELSAGPVTGGWTGSVARLFLPVRDRGQTFVHAAGHISCAVGGREHTYDVTVGTVLPEGEAVLPVNAPGLVTGRLPCRVRLRDSAGQLVTWSGEVRVPPRVITRSYHLAKGVYVSLPQGTVPPWAIALMIIGALAVALLLVALFRGRRPGRSAIRVPRRAGRRPA